MEVRQASFHRTHQMRSFVTAGQSGSEKDNRASLTSGNENIDDEEPQELQNLVRTAHDVQIDLDFHEDKEETTRLLADTVYSDRLST